MDQKPLFTSVGESPRTRSDPLVLREIVRADLFRANPAGGWHEPAEVEVDDLIVNVGRNYIARRIAGGDSQTAPGSAMAYMCIGTGTGAASLASTLSTSEVLRKLLAISSAGITASNVYTAVATFGGAADSVTSLAIGEASIWNHASSGQGAMMQHVNFAAVTLAASDLLRLTLETNVGSS